RMNKNGICRLLYCLSMMGLSACQPTRILQQPESTKVYGFTIKLPRAWQYKESIGWDSFVGKIEGPGVVLSFDMSDEGYASSLRQSPSDSILGVKWPQRVETDTVDGYHRTIILPTDNTGMMGIYLQHLDDGFTFNLYGYGLVPKDRRKLRKALGSIRILR
ncbi:MAG: hypothetical protein AAF206_27595, partial [Bacteroidota bacterium]